MEFKLGDKVLVNAPSWQERCIIIEWGFSGTVMCVRRNNGAKTAIYKSWASKIIH